MRGEEKKERAMQNSGKEEEKREEGSIRLPPTLSKSKGQLLKLRSRLGFCSSTERVQTEIGQQPPLSSPFPGPPPPLFPGGFQRPHDLEQHTHRYRQTQGSKANREDDIFTSQHCHVEGLKPLMVDETFKETVPSSPSKWWQVYNFRNDYN